MQCRARVWRRRRRPRVRCRQIRHPSRVGAWDQLYVATSSLPQRATAADRGCTRECTDTVIVGANDASGDIGYTDAVRVNERLPHSAKLVAESASRITVQINLLEVNASVAALDVPTPTGTVASTLPASVAEAATPLSTEEAASSTSSLEPLSSLSSTAERTTSAAISAATSAATATDMSAAASSPSSVSSGASSPVFSARPH